VVSSELADRVRRRLVSSAVPLAEAVTAEAPDVTDDVALARMHDQVSAELVGAGPLEPLLGLPSVTDEDLVEALFADGVSTKDTVTALSGRGVGMAALRAAARSEGGNVTVISEQRRGTAVRFEFPLDQLAERDALTRRPARLTG